MIPTGDAYVSPNLDAAMWCRCGWHRIHPICPVCLDEEKRGEGHQCPTCCSGSES